MWLAFANARVAFANAKATHIFSTKILADMPYLMIKVFNYTLSNAIISFGPLGPEEHIHLQSHLGFYFQLLGSLDICIHVAEDLAPLTSDHEDLDSN